jgi:[citrate (pro-3S)-lyase] ligase
VELCSGDPFRGSDLERLKDFLAAEGLDYDNKVQYSVYLADGGRIAAAGSLDGRILKCIAVSSEHKAEGLAAIIVTELIRKAASDGEYHLFLFTKPENEELFAAFGFYPVAKTDAALLMENKKNGIGNFVASLGTPVDGAAAGAVVMNCNPFTLGHQYLVESAAAQCDNLHLFVVSENKSAFPADVRIRLVREGAAHIKNTTVHSTGPYLVSAVTFPDYFIKEKIRAASANTELDLTIFAERFAKPLGIKRRFVGEEPFDPVTASYNKQMQELLPRYGIAVSEIKRLEAGGLPVSASRVRELLAEKRFDEIRKLVPASTMAYLEQYKR